jgi:hypothetical protein
MSYSFELSMYIIILAEPNRERQRNMKIKKKWVTDCLLEHLLPRERYEHYLRASLVDGLKRRPNEYTRPSSKRRP